MSYLGNWRDVVLLLCVLLFTYIWWDVARDRSNWLVMFILLILLSVITAVCIPRRFACRQFIPAQAAPQRSARWTSWWGRTKVTRSHRARLIGTRPRNRRGDNGRWPEPSRGRGKEQARGTQVIVIEM